MADDEQRLRDIQREYLDFLDDEVSRSGRSHHSGPHTAIPNAKGIRKK